MGKYYHWLSCQQELLLFIFHLKLLSTFAPQFQSSYNYGQLFGVFQKMKKIFGMVSFYFLQFASIEHFFILFMSLKKIADLIVYSIHRVGLPFVTKINYFQHHDSYFREYTNYFSPKSIKSGYFERKQKIFFLDPSNSFYKSNIFFSQAFCFYQFLKENSICYERNCKLHQWVAVYFFKKRILHIWP